MRKYLIFTKLALLALFPLAGCFLSESSSEPQAPTPEMADKNYMPNQEGVVEYVWEPPMVDVVDVPPGLDPEGIYYRPGHQEVIEVRQGRWKYYKKDQKQ